MKFVKFNANPAGKLTTDCLVRAVSSALGISWEESMMKLAESACKHHLMLNDRSHSVLFMKDLGWKKFSGKSKSIKSLKLKEPTIILAHYRKKYHVVYFDGKALIDTFNSSNYKVDYYYIKSND